MNNPEASAHACFYLMFGYLHYLAKVSAPKGSGGSAGRREGFLQGERRGDSRHRSKMKEGAGGQLLGRNQPTSDFRTFIFHQKHVIWEILRLLCFFFWHAHYLFFFFLIFNAPFQKSTLVSVEITGNQDCKHLVSAWLGEQSCGDSAGVEEGWDAERGRRRRTSNSTRVNSDWRMPASLAHGICFRPR